MKRIIIAFVLIFSFFSLINISKAEMTQDEINMIQNLFNFGDDNNTQDTIAKTPRQQAREVLIAFTNWEKYANLIDDLIDKHISDIDYLNRIYWKIIIFDLSKYHSSVPQKDATLAAVVSYIKVSLEEVLWISSN